jgi:hypothetical protein
MEQFEDAFMSSVGCAVEIFIPVEPVFTLSVILLEICHSTVNIGVVQHRDAVFDQNLDLFNYDLLLKE